MNFEGVENQIQQLRLLPQISLLISLADLHYDKLMQ